MSNLENYFLKTMLRAYRMSWECCKMSNSYYYEYFTDIFKHIINTGTLNTIEDQGIIHSFSFGLTDTLHFVYSRNMARSKGNGLSLIKDYIINNKIKVSFITKDFYQAFEKNNLDIIYEPFKRYVKPNVR